MKWFNHPRVFWEAQFGPWAFRVPLRRRWYLAIRDPVYVGMWVTLLTIIVLTAWVVLGA